LTLPKKADPPQIEFFGEELVVLKQQIEEHFGVEITDDRLRGAIKLHNETRSLLRKLYDLRKSDYPPVSGAETLAITVASTAMPKSRFNELLKQLLTELSDKECIKDYRARLMIIGSELDDPKYLEAIESQGGLIVTDSLCFGSRLIFSGVDENAKDPLKALAQYYLADRPSCPHICTEYKSRNEYVMNMIRDYRVDGVILERLAFCDLWGFEGYLLDGDFKKIKLPFLSVEREYNQSSIGQLRTRVQALLETMED
jgi:benzoyl-CoA reductase/2-hydroxyglutaryl-CoA dehydratase subunit BcrC/BadD/HgdB